MLQLWKAEKRRRGCAQRLFDGAKTFFDLVLSGKVEDDWLTLYGQLMAKALAPNYGTAVDYAKTPAQPSPALLPAAYIGGYRNDLFGPVEIVAGDQGLWLKLGPQQQPSPMQHLDRDVFTYQPAGENAAGRSAVTFTIAADQKAATVTIENFDVDGQGTFTRAPAPK